MKEEDARDKWHSTDNEQLMDNITHGKETITWHRLLYRK